MSGRGRGISNKPAWMTRAEGAPGGVPGVPTPEGHHRDMPPMGGGGGGGYRGDRYNDRGPPPPRGYDRDNNRDRDRYNDRGGGGGRYDDYGRRDSYRDRGRGDWRDDRRGGGPPPHHFRGGGGGRDFDRRGGGGGGGGDRGRGGGHHVMPNHRNPGTISFRSYEEEQNWVDDRRRKRLSRKSKFDVTPTPEQAAADAAMVALSNPAATDFAGINAADRNFSAVPQQTRHARRLYIGQLPPDVTEDELHVFFRGAIERSILPNSPGTVNGRLEEDPILSVYINHERRFCFLEFKSVEMTTACMDLDGIDVNGKGKVKVKRPNDYNPSMAPKANPSVLPQLDTSRLGIISGTVPDGPNKIFVGGLHYHLTEEQVLELLQAFGKVKAFHLVKNEPDATTSKGYCFVEYADPSVTPIAVMGLNGMDLGGGKMLTARVAGERGGQANIMSPAAAVPGAPAPATANSIPANANIVHGYDVEALVDAALGQRDMPTAPMYLDGFGMPLTRLAPTPFVAAPATPLPNASTPQRGADGGRSSALEIANAALAAMRSPPTPAGSAPTRILVLSNMVVESDLTSDEEYEGLFDEVKEECAKFGRLNNMKIPRRADPPIQQSAILKIFLEYASTNEALAASRELEGRKFGDNVVETSFFSEADYAAGRLS